MLGACSFLLVGFDHACPRFGRLDLAHVMPVPESDLDSNHACPRFAQARAWPMSCLSPIRISTRIMPVPDSPGSSLAHVMPVPDSDLDSNHACPRFAPARAWPTSCLSPIRISTRIMPVPDSPRLELGPCHACPRFGSRLGSCLSPIRPARAWPTSCLSPIRISTRIMPVPDSARLELGPRHACPRFGSRLTDTRPTRPGAPPGQARRSSHRHSRRRSMSPIRPEAPRDRVRPALRLD